MSFQGNELSSKTVILLCVLPFAVVASNSSNTVLSKHMYRYVDLMLRK